MSISSGAGPGPGPGPGSGSGSGSGPGRPSTSFSIPPIPHHHNKNVFFFLYEGFTDLDVFGSSQVYATTRQLHYPNGQPSTKCDFLPEYHVKYVARAKDTLIRSRTGLPILVPYSLQQLIDSKAGEDTHPDIFIIPGSSPGPMSVVMRDHETIRQLTGICNRCPLSYSTCTGAAIFALTGLLKGRRATTSKQPYHTIADPEGDLSIEFPALKDVLWTPKARYIMDINPATETGIATSSGISAGIDLTLAIIDHIFGPEISKFCCTEMEYIWNADPDHDPFAPPLRPIIPLSTRSLTRYSPFSAVWLYRSFYDDADINTEYNKLQSSKSAIWTLEVSDQGTVTGHMDFLDGTGLNTTGTIQGTSIRLQSIGISGTLTDGWQYEHKGIMGPTWPHASYLHMRTIFLGSAYRCKAHSYNSRRSIYLAPAGMTASFVCINLSNIPLYPGNIEPLPSIATQLLSRPTLRLHSAVWHLTRNHWDQLNESAQQQIRSLHWHPPRPTIEYDKNHLPRLPIRYMTQNGSGEDYLFWCRSVHQLLKTALGSYNGWMNIPTPTDIAAPIIPPVWTHADNNYAAPSTTSITASLRFTKSDEFYYSRLVEWDALYKNAHYLRTLTLGELGCQLEFNVNAAILTRWSALPRDPLTNEPIPDGRAIDDFHSKYDQSSYDNLCDYYSSHIHPIFWKLLLWIDDRIDDWYEAHISVSPDAIIETTIHDIPWFAIGKWVKIADPWTGTQMKTTEEHMKEVITIIARDIQRSIANGNTAALIRTNTPPSPNHHHHTNEHFSVLFNTESPRKQL